MSDREIFSDSGKREMFAEARATSNEWITGNWIDCENKQDSIKFKTRTMEEAERIGDALNAMADAVNTK